MYPINNLFVLSSIILFIALDEAEQAEAIWEGVLIGDREEDEHKILLYQIDAFYMEVYYYKEYYVIRRFRPFLSTDPLELI
jgi:hypothetical protein